MHADAVDPRSGFVYVQSNELGRNRLLVFRRCGDGTLSAAGAYETGGACDGKPHLTRGAHR